LITVGSQLSLLIFFAERNGPVVFVNRTGKQHSSNREHSAHRPAIRYLGAAGEPAEKWSANTKNGLQGSAMQKGRCDAPPVSAAQNRSSYAAM
jgi:hypothetical protein